MVVILYALQTEISQFKKRVRVVRKRSIDGAAFYEGALKDAGKTSARPLLLVQTGMGVKSASSGVENLIRHYKTDLIVSTGFAGALKDGIKAGDIIFAKNVLYLRQLHGLGGGKPAVDIHLKCRQDYMDLTKRVCRDAGIRLHCGDTVTVNKVIETVSDKVWLGKALNVISADMETVSIAEAAAREDVPFISIRSISDDIGLDLNISRLGVVSEDGTVDIKRLGLKLISNIQYLPDLMRLRQHALIASKNLSVFLSSFITNLEDVGAG